MIHMRQHIAAAFDAIGSPALDNHAIRELFDFDTYAAAIDLARGLRTALAPWRPRDLVDIQGFIWVTHSDEYADWPWE